ncbi:hypothetical protein LPB140_04410 [Sphingorhabdus lutea]|uniref:UrcA family protein n=1 Tax=Sphingorhabdus lutea TaxID=1913578 RepID=A0A1L3JAL4_9SPHN|nr:UrcA family protein [Sphingorhabdus lutea]APG62174.1 hypothetical protein LPB140_04410 [Sphingorhabdus lutea]
MKKIGSKLSALAIIGCGGTSLALSPVYAQQDSMSAVNISYADLDLTSKAGQEAMDNRIYAASKKVCGLSGANGKESLKIQSARRDCQQIAYKQAKVKVTIAIAQMKNNQDEKDQFASNKAVIVGN